MTDSVYYNLSSAGVIIYPCFLESYGFGGDYPAVVWFVLELDTNNDRVARAVRSLRHEVLYDESYEYMLLNNPSKKKQMADGFAQAKYQKTGETTLGVSYSFNHEEHKSSGFNLQRPSDIQMTWVADKKPVVSDFTKAVEPHPNKSFQRLSVLLPYEYEPKNNGANAFLGEEQKQDLFAHVTIVQFMEMIGVYPEKENLMFLDSLEEVFVSSMSPKMRLFFDRHITHSSTMIGVPSEEGITAFSSAFGRFLLYPNGSVVHESQVDEKDWHLLYYHHPAPKFNHDSDEFKQDLYRIVKRTVVQAVNHSNPKILLAQMFWCLEEKFVEKQRPLLLPLGDSGGFVSWDASGALLHNLKKKKDSDIDPKHSVLFAKTIAQMFYICLSSWFFEEYTVKNTGFERKFSPVFFMEMYEKANEKTLSLITSVREDMPVLLKYSQTQDKDNPEGLTSGFTEQAVITTPMAILMMGLMQSTTSYTHVVGTEANPMLIMASSLVNFNIGDISCEFSLANRTNRSSASLIELSGKPSINILSRFTSTDVSFSKNIDLDQSVYVSSLDKRMGGERLFLKLYQKDKGRDCEPYVIQDLSLYEASQAIVQYKDGKFSQVKAGVFISPYSSAELGTDLNAMLFWLSFYYETVRVTQVTGTVVGLNHAVHVVSFFQPKGESLDFADSTQRQLNIVGFGNIPLAKTVDDFALWTYHESLFVLTQDIFVVKNSEKNILDAKSIIKDKTEASGKPLIEKVEEAKPSSVQDRQEAKEKVDQKIADLAKTPDSELSLSLLDVFEEEYDADDDKKDDDDSIFDGFKDDVLDLPEHIAATEEPTEPTDSTVKNVPDKSDEDDD